MQGSEEMKASIALQILPLSTDKGRLAVIEDVIEYLQKQPVRQLVTPLQNHVVVRHVMLYASS